MGDAMTEINNNNPDWGSLGFDYIRTDKRYISKWKNGNWDNGRLVEDNTITLNEGSPVLHYGQSCFEGLKAFSAENGKVFMFRPDENAKRLNRSAERVMMAKVPEEKFIDACKQVVKANIKWVPPYGSGASLYIRPYMIGVGENIGVTPASEYIFSVFVMPVGPYFKGGMKKINLMTSAYDRAAPNGTGAAKVGGNYAGSLMPHEEAVKAGFIDCIYLDPATHTKIEEVGAANFFGITKTNKFVTPKSSSILPSITKHSLIYIAKKYLNMKTEQRDVNIYNLDEFTEAGACGTAAVISPIGSIYHKGNIHKFYKEGKEAGPVTKKLYEILTGIQQGSVNAPKGWIFEI